MGERKRTRWNFCTDGSFLNSAPMGGMSDLFVNCVNGTAIHSNRVAVALHGMTNTKRFLETARRRTTPLVLGIELSGSSDVGSLRQLRFQID